MVANKQEKYSVEDLLFEMAMNDYTKDMINLHEHNFMEDQVSEQAIIQHKKEKHQKGSILKAVALGYNGGLNGNK